MNGSDLLNAKVVSTVSGGIRVRGANDPTSRVNWKCGPNGDIECYMNIYGETPAQFFQN